MQNRKKAFWYTLIIHDKTNSFHELKPSTSSGGLSWNIMFNKRFGGWCKMTVWAYYCPICGCRTPYSHDKFAHESAEGKRDMYGNKIK